MVLIVDHDPQFLEEAATILGPNDVWFATSTEHAWSLVSSVGDFVTAALVDIELPSNDGVQFIGELTRSCPEIPVIAITASPQDSRLETARVAGARESLRKPITSAWRETIARARASQP